MQKEKRSQATRKDPWLHGGFPGKVNDLARSTCLWAELGWERPGVWGSVRAQRNWRASWVLLIGLVSECWRAGMQETLQGSGKLWLAPTGIFLEHISQGTWLQTQISLRKKESAEGMFWFGSIESPWVALGLWAWLEVPCASLSLPHPTHLAPLYILAHLCTGFSTRQAFLISDEDSHWPLPASIVLWVDYLRKKKKEHHSSNSSLSTRNDTIDLAWVTCPFPEAMLHLGAFWSALSEAQRLGASPCEPPGCS